MNNLLEKRLLNQSRPKTIYEFAEAIGVSATTISRTLSGRGRVSAATRQMILTQMETLGYTPNVTAQRLVTGRTQTVLLDCGKSSLFADLFIIELVHGIQMALEQRRYGLLLNAPGGDSLRTVTTGTVDGVILVAGDNTGEDEDTDPAVIAEQITVRNVPCVVICHDAVAKHRGVGSVVVGLQDGAIQVARKLVAEGHRRIGFLSSRPNDKVLRHFREELTRLGVDLPERQIIIAGRTVDGGEQGMRELFRQAEPPTVVFTRTDTLAAGALRAARRMGVRVPEDVSLVGHDDVPFASLIEPPLTTVRVDCTRIGEAAAQMLLDMLDTPDFTPPMPRLIPTALVNRDSVAAI